MILLGTVVATMTGHHFAWAWPMSSALLLLGSLTFAHLLLQPVASTGWDRLGRYLLWLPIKGGRSTLEAWAKVWTLPRVFAFSVVAMLAYGTQALVFSWFCHISGIGISVADCVLIFIKATLLGAFSMLPGGLGAMETSIVYQLGQKGADYSVAVSLAIAIRLVTLWVGIVVGVLALLTITRNTGNT